MVDHDQVLQNDQLAMNDVGELWLLMFRIENG